MTDETTVDWRGTPIRVGDTVIYGAPVGRSIAMVEAIVDGFTDSGRVWLLVKHRAFGGYGEGKPRVHVGPDRLTVVTQLPPTDLPLEEDKNGERRRRSFEYHSGQLQILEAGEVPEYYQHDDWRGQPRWHESMREDLVKFHRAELRKLEKLGATT